MFFEKILANAQNLNLGLYFEDTSSENMHLQQFMKKHALAGVEIRHYGPRDLKVARQVEHRLLQRRLTDRTQTAGARAMIEGLMGNLP